MKKDTTENLNLLNAYATALIPTQLACGAVITTKHLIAKSLLPNPSGQLLKNQPPQNLINNELFIALKTV